jgi:hypothetical protein
MFSTFNIFKISVVLLIALMVLGVTGLAFTNAKAEASDKQISSNVTVIYEALKVYYDVNGYYPAAANGMPKGIEAYLDFYPKGSDCPYNYERKASGADYELSFCLGKSGQRLMTSQGVK